MVKSNQFIPTGQIIQKISKYGRKAGAKVVYGVLLMYFAFRRKDTPKWAKGTILGSIAYFLSPLDFIPDLTPVLGFTDDLGVLLTGLVTIASYINDDVRIKAMAKMDTWFDKEAIIVAVEEMDRDIDARRKQRE